MGYWLTDNVFPNFRSNFCAICRRGEQRLMTSSSNSASMVTLIIAETSEPRLRGAEASERAFRGGL
jgi:hypothetical protein